MRLFEKMKPYQVFLVWVLFVLFFDSFEGELIGYIIRAAYFLSMVGWVYLVGVYFNNEVAEEIRIKDYNENVWFLLWFLSGVGFSVFSNSESYFRPIFLLAGFISGIRSIAFTAKSIKQFTTRSEQSFGKYIPEFLMVAIFLLGVWIIQPKINEIAKSR